MIAPMSTVSVSVLPEAVTSSLICFAFGLEQRVCGADLGDQPAGELLADPFDLTCGTKVVTEGPDLGRRFTMAFTVQTGAGVGVAPVGK